MEKTYRPGGNPPSGQERRDTTGAIRAYRVPFTPQQRASMDRAYEAGRKEGFVSGFKKRAK